MRNFINYLPATVKATGRTGHDLNVMVGALSALHLLHQVLDASKAVRRSKVKKHFAILVQQRNVAKVLVISARKAQAAV